MKKSKQEKRKKSVHNLSNTLLKSKQKNRFLKKYKPYIAAILSASAIGIILGIVMLQLFTVVEGDTNFTSNHASLTPTSNQTKEKNEDTTTIEPLVAYVIQGGVFTEELNATEWAKIYNEHEIQTFIWERENEFYLFIGLSSTKERAVEEAEKIKEKDLDVFVKEWSTDSYEIDRNAYDWMDAFQNVWLNTVQSLDQDKKISIEQWEQLINKSDDFPNGANNELVERVNMMIDRIHEENKPFLPYDLLQLWKEYENVLSSI